jgi:ABC-type sugar transport system permease subunit
MKSSPRAALLFLLPSVIFVGLFSIFPIVESFRLSFYRLILTLPWLGQKMVGLENYTDLVSDPVARDAIGTTLIFIAVTIPLELLLGLGIALVLNQGFRGRGLLRAVVLVPWAIPTVVSSQMWRFIFNDRYGLVNFLLFGADTSRYIAPLADPYLAMISIMAAEIWKTTPFAALILLAGLQGISDDLYEAASVDGASSWQKFRHITLPLLKPALLLALLFRTIDALRVFDLVYVMTQGGPADATNVLQFYGYKKTFAEGMVGYGSAIAVTVFAISLILSLAYLRTFRASRLQERNHEA